MKTQKINPFTSIPIIALLLFLHIFPLQGYTQGKTEQRIIVMARPNTISLPAGKERAAIGEATLPQRIRKILQDFSAQEIAKGIPKFNRSDTLRVLADGRIYKTPDYTNLFVITLADSNLREALIDSLEQLPGIVIAEKDQKPIFRETIPNDTHFQTRQWNLKNTGQFGGTPGADIKAALAWDITTGSSAVMLGIIDTGVQSNHPDLQSKFTGDTQVTGNHGTHVAGIAAAKGNNGQGIAGVDWNAMINAQHIADFSITVIVEALDDAVVAGAKVLNNSWGMQAFSQTLSDAFLSAYQADVLPVVANPETSAEGEFPNSFGPWIVNVAASRNDDGKADYSLDRYYTDVAAPGGNNDATEEHDIYSTVPTSAYDYLAGTSMAAPHVTGLAGLLLASNSNLHNYDLEWIIKRSADDKGPIGPDPSFGYGRINAYEAVRHVAAPYTVTHGNTTSFAKTDNNIKVTFLAPPTPTLSAGIYWVDRWELEADVTFSQTYSEIPWAWLSQMGYSAANPNDAEEYMFENSSYTQTTVRTYFYYIRTDNIGQTINKWAPYDPNALPMQYTVVGKPGTPPTPPPAPSNLTITNAGNLGENVQLSWSVSTGADSYNIYRCMTNSVQNCIYVQIGSATSTNYTDDQVVIRSGSQSNDTFHYYVTAVNANGESGPSNTVSTIGEQILFKQEDANETSLPETFILLKNYPNPFNPQTEIRYALPEAGYVELAILNVLGQPIRILVAGHHAKGWYRKIWDSRDGQGKQVASGVYLYRISVQKGGQHIFSDLKKLSLVR